jgi:hypothetical protein
MKMQNDHNMLTTAQLAWVNQSPYVETIIALTGWILYFTFVHTPLYNQLCSLNEGISLLIPQTLRGSYWGGMILLIMLTFRQLPKPGPRMAITIIIFACVVVIAQDVGLHGITEARNWMTSHIQPGTAAFWWMVGCYALILAIPFMPGIELGLLLMLMYGMPGIAAVYGATILGLLVPYFIGRTLPEHALKRFFKFKPGYQCKLTGWIGSFARTIRIVDSDYVRKVINCRPLVLAVAFNVPCNSIIGGGGFIAMVTGAQRFVSFVPYLLVITLATLPIPLLAFAGVIHVDSLLAGQELSQGVNFCYK